MNRVPGDEGSLSLEPIPVERSRLPAVVEISMRGRVGEGGFEERSGFPNLVRRTMSQVRPSRFLPAGWAVATSEERNPSSRPSWAVPEVVDGGASSLRQTRGLRIPYQSHELLSCQGPSLLPSWPPPLTGSDWGGSGVAPLGMKNGIRAGPGAPQQ